MSHFQTHGRPSTGFLVLQHQGFDKDGYDLIQRAGQHCIRIIGRMTQDDGDGRWIEDVDARSDLMGGNFWNADYSQRPIAGAAFAWPAMIQTTPSNDVPTLDNGPSSVVPIVGGSGPVSPTIPVVTP